MKVLKQLACVAGSVFACVALATITGATTLLPQNSATLPPPVVTIEVTREVDFKDLDLMHLDYKLSRLTDAVAAYMSMQTESLIIEDLAYDLRMDGWTVAATREDDLSYLYIIDENGDVREICYERAGLVVSDDDDPKLMVEVVIAQEV